MRGFLCAAAMVCALVSMPSDADACGGCFHPVAETGVSVVTDHRMVFKLSKTETILWDQVRYSGAPEEFAWVLPVRDGARVELSRDEWIAALDASTKTTVTGPERFCNGGGGSGGSFSGGCGSTETTTQSTSRGTDDSPRDAGGFVGNENVQVLGQSVIGPYQAVTIRATGGQGIDEWLIANGFAIPDDVRPTVDAYTAEKFDFIALRLRPGQGVNAMRPVRVVTQGADPTLPLRMVAAGVGAKVGLTLWVIAEGRYHPQNFPDGVIDDTKLTWDGVKAKSNLAEMQMAALASNGGRSWITEAAIRATATRTPESPLVMPNPVLSDAYRSSCITRPYQTVRCTEDELPPPNGTPDDQELPDAGADADADADVDAGASDAGDAGADAAKPFDAGTSNPCTKQVSGCDGFDDYTVAMRGLATSDVWITRLRADLPVTALSIDLKIEAATDQSEIDPQHHTETFSDPKFDPCAARGGSSTSSSASDDDGGGGCACRTVPLRTRAGTWLLIVGTAIVASRIIRRRRVH
jgi:hypothetical protein